MKRDRDFKIKSNQLQIAKMETQEGTLFDDKDRQASQNAEYFDIKKGLFFVYYQKVYIFRFDTRVQTNTKRACRANASNEKLSDRDPKNAGRVTQFLLIIFNPSENNERDKKFKKVS